MDVPEFKILIVLKMFYLKINQLQYYIYCFFFLLKEMMKWSEEFC